MTRHQRKFRPDFPAPPLLTIKLAGELGDDVRNVWGAGQRDRFRAITCILSASAGWRDASAELGGAFAATARTNPWSDTPED